MAFTTPELTDESVSIGVSVGTYTVSPSKFVVAARASGRVNFAGFLPGLLPLHEP